MAPRTDSPTWLRSDRLLARSVARPVTRFLHIEASGGVLLAAAAVVALIWANSPWSASYRALWATELTIDLAGHVLTHDLRHWINDGLMALFFFVIGLEVKQELTSGQLTSPRDAAVPAAGALGGMVVPAALYLALNVGGSGGAGWGIPMATDVAFALGVLALLGSRVPAELKVLLLALAIVDDIGAIIVIAVFYSDGLDVRWAVAALAGLLLVAVLRRVGVRYLPIYVVIGTAVWLATFESGIHATIAGVALGLMAPARALLPEVDADRIADSLSADDHVTAAEVRDISFRLRESIPVTERLQDFLHPWTSYLIVPVFALANAGVEMSGESLGDALTSPVALGVVAGLVLGKLVGVAGAIFLAVHLGIGRLPEGITSRHIIGMAGIAGIGFTVSIFVAGLAFDAPGLTDQAKIGVLVASVIAACVGSILLMGTGPPPTPTAQGDEGAQGSAALTPPSTDNLFNLNQGLKNFDNALTPAARAQSIFIGYNGGHVLPSAAPAGVGGSGDPCSTQLGGSSFADMTLRFFQQHLKNQASTLTGQGEYHLATAADACTHVTDIDLDGSYAIGAITSGVGAGAPSHTKIADGPIRVAGMPFVDADVTTLTPDARVFFALSVGTSPADARIVQNNMMPLREMSIVNGVARHIELPAVAVDVPAGQSLFLTVSPVSDMSFGSSSRVPGAVTLNNTVVRVPVV